MSEEFFLSGKLPPYVFNIVNDLKTAARSRGEDIVDMGMGNPDLPTPEPIVEKLVEAARNPRNHRYSVSRGIEGLREAIARRYARGWGVALDPEREVVATLGAKEGLAHLVMTVLAPGDVALVVAPAYPIHTYSVIMAGGRLVRVPMSDEDSLLESIRSAVRLDRPRLLIISFPNNPTGACVERSFFSSLVDLARESGMLIIHDFAYADLTFDGYRAPSILEFEGAAEVAVELFSMSKSYSMAGWRVGFCVGNARVVQSLARVKSYLDYGMFQPIQIAAITALNECDEYVKRIAGIYEERRNVLLEVLGRAGWEVRKPRGTMFIWAPIPEEFRGDGSLEFAKLLLGRAKLGVSPGVGFGEAGEGSVRFALVENRQRIRQAGRGVRRVMNEAKGRKAWS